jgi:hypothetical protein
LTDPTPSRKVIAPTVTAERLDWWDTTGNVGLSVFDAPARHPVTGTNRTYERGQAEVEIKVGAEPPGRLLRLPFDTTGLVGYHQPALTAQEILDGALRPEHIVDSWAFYHATKGGVVKAAEAAKYQTGKAFHLERFWCVDRLGLKTWCRTDIANNVLTVTLPLGAVYPVTVGPTFGYTSIGANAGGSFNDPLVCAFTPIEAGTISSMTSYITRFATRLMSNAVYADASGNPSGLGTSTGTQSVTATGWQTITGMSYAFTAVQQWLATWSEDLQIRIAYDTGGFSGQGRKDSGETFPTWPNPFTSASSLDLIYSIYATYTAAAAGNPWYYYQQQALAGGL